MNVREDEAAEALAKQKENEQLSSRAQELLNTKVDETKLRSLMSNIHSVKSTTEVLLMLARMHEITGDTEGAVRLSTFASVFAPYEVSTWKVSK